MFVRKETRTVFTAAYHNNEPVEMYPGVCMARSLCDSCMSSPRTLWGADFGECTTCRQTGDAAWTCPAALSAYADIGGSGADIVELDGDRGKPHR